MRTRARGPPCGARVMRARRTLLQYVAPIVVGWALGCDNPASPQPSADLLPPLTGSIQVSAPTTGSDLDPNGYTATLDLLQSQSVPTNGSTTFSGVLLGVHAVQLSGVASNCGLNSSNPQTVTLTGSSATVSFSVGCTAPTGTLKVTTSTSGSVPTSNYTVTVDGNAASAQQIAPNNGSVTFSNLSATGHSVALSGFPANCTVTSANPQSVNVPAGGTATVAFTVSCNATATTGTLTIATSTAGQNQPTSYTLRATTPSGTSETLTFRSTDGQTFSGIATGNYTLQILNLPANCTLVSGTNPRTVTVTAGTTTSTTFSVSCTATTTTGTLTIATSTTGQNQPTSYTTRTTTPSGTSETLTFGATDSQTFSGIATGNYTLQILDLPANCSLVSGTNPRTVTVTAGTTTSTTFSVSCTATTTTGTLTVTTTTTGSNLDLDGYTFTVTGGGQTATRAIATNGTSTFNGIPTGSYQVQLTPSTVAANCTVTNANPQTVNVPAGGTTVTFPVSCTSATITIKT